MSMRAVIEGIEREMFERAIKGESIKHICQENSDCKNAEYCTTAIEVTTYGDLAENTRRYIKGIGKCEE